MKKALLTLVHYLTYLDLLAKIGRKIGGKFVPGWIVDIGYYALLAIDFGATQIENKYKRTEDEYRKPVKLDELKEKDPFKVKRHYKRRRDMKAVVERAKVDWLKKYSTYEEVQAEIDKINQKRNGK
jgi:hypothetical protein